MVKRKLKRKGKVRKKKRGRNSNTFIRDKQGNISNTKLSANGKRQIKLFDGELLHFSDVSLKLKGNKLVGKGGKVFDTINSDRKVNKLHFKILMG